MTHRHNPSSSSLPVKILLLGATGSIGTSACACIRQHPDKFQLVGLSTHRSVDKLTALSREFNVPSVCVADHDTAQRARTALGVDERLFTGRQGLVDLIETTDFDVLLNALVGEVGFRPTVAALRRGKRVALANKESLVIGGDFLRTLLDEGTGELIPVDSEHSAILQCLSGERRETIESIILTASGGPFRELPLNEFASITPARALQHPTWSMGPKITIDSATLVNKGFEVIEAHHLFHVSFDKLRVLIHPQSIIHSMVEFHDGSVIAQMGMPSMELPIQFALSFPDRLAKPNNRLHLSHIKTLSFEEPDTHRFPCLNLSIEAGRRGGTYPAALNAANEIAVQLFLDGKIGFNQIAAILDESLARHQRQEAGSVEIIETVDRETREWAAAKYR